jgi:cell shape-determining protein MreD
LLLVLIAWSIQSRDRSIWLWVFIGGGLVSLVSAIPAGAPVWIYLIIAGLIRLFSQRTMEVPVLWMLIATILGTLIQKVIEIIVLFMAGSPLPFSESIVLVALPSALLNLFFALPVYALITDLSRWIYPVEVQI